MSTVLIKQVLFWIFLCVIIVITKSRMVTNKIDIRYREYYYDSILSKDVESSSLGSCSTYDYIYKEYIPSEKIITLQQKLMTTKNYFQVATSVCNSSHFKNYITNFKGCSTTQSNRKKSMEPRLIRQSHFHPYHPRCTTSNAASACKLPDTIQLVELRHRYFKKQPFVLKFKNTAISKNGFLNLKCGQFSLLGSCNSSREGLQLLDSRNCAREKCNIRREKNVFVITQTDDLQIGQVYTIIDYNNILTSWV